MRKAFLAVTFLMLPSAGFAQFAPFPTMPGLPPLGTQPHYMGNLSANPILPPAPIQPPNTFNNSLGTYQNSPHLYNQQGQFLGDVNSNPLDPNSIANPLGRYGSPLSPDSVNNPLGQYGSPLAPQSPNNPLGTGLSIYGR